MNEKNIQRKTLKTVIAAALICATLSAGFAMPVSAASEYIQVTGAATVNVRSDADNKANVVAIANKGDVYEYVDQQKDADGKTWYKIQLTDDTYGWIVSTYSNYISNATTTKTTTTTAAIVNNTNTAIKVQITGDVANVRSDAGSSYTKLGTTKKGQTYAYLASKKAANGQVWYKIQFTPDIAGWVISSYSKVIDTSATTTTTTATVANNTNTAIKVQITGDIANVRSDAGSSYTKLGTTKKGQTYAYLASKKAANGQVWYKIQFTPDIAGWVISSYSKVIDTSATTTTTTTTTASSTTANSSIKVQITGDIANVRSDAGSSYTKLGTTKKGQKFTYLGSKKAANGKVWYKIQFTPDIAGWVISSYSKVVDTSATTTTTTTTTASSTTANSAIKVQITGDIANVRSDAGSSYTKLGTTKKGQKFTYLGSKKAANGKVWYKIQFTPDIAGWVISSYSKVVDTSATTTTTTTTTASSTTANSAIKVQITGDIANVRSDAGSSYTKLGTTKKGQKFTYLGSKKAANGKVWYKIQFTPDIAGWVISSYSKVVDTSVTTTTTTTPAATDTSKETVKVVITGDIANVRSDAGSSYTKLGTTKKGQSFKYLDSKKAANGKVWYKIQYTSDIAGWVISSYSKVTTVVETQKQTVEVTGNTVNVRTDAGTSYAKVGVAVKGQSYKYLDSKKGTNGKVWYKIQYTSDVAGWISSQYSVAK